MIDENSNPFNAAAKPATTDYGAMGKSIADGMKGSGFFGKDGFSVATASAPTRSVDAATGTVQGQIDSILAKDGPMMQRTRANALALAADRGLINSSMAVENAQGAVIDRATPIAQADANIYDGAARDNQNATLQTNLANAAAKNNFGGLIASQMGDFVRQDKQNTWQSGENTADRTFRTSERVAGQDFATGERVAGQQFTSGERAADRAFQSGERVAGQDFTAGENQLNRDQQNANFDKQVAADNARLLQQHDLTLKQMGFSAELNNKNLPQQYAADLAKSTLNSINAIAADPNLSPDAKKGAIQNVIDAANASAALGEKLYGVTLPRQSMPTGSTATTDGSTPSNLSQTQINNNKAKGLPADFDSAAYLKNNPDVAAEVAEGKLTAESHWLQYGRNESRRDGTWKPT